MNKELKSWEQEIYTDAEVDELSAWLATLTIAQIAFLKDSYQAMMASQLEFMGQDHVH